MNTKTKDYPDQKVPVFKKYKSYQVTLELEYREDYNIVSLPALEAISFLKCDNARIRNIRTDSDLVYIDFVSDNIEETLNHMQNVMFNGIGIESVDVIQLLAPITVEHAIRTCVSHEHNELD